MLAFDPHPTRVQLRQEFQKLLGQRNWTRKQLAQASGIEAVTISNIFNNKQLLMLYQLDAITEAFGLPAGHFYAYFKVECCNHEGSVRPAKSGGFVLRCLQLGKEEVIDDFIALILEDKEVTRQKKLLLEIAECIYDSALRTQALPYYEKLIEIENKISERYAIARYRRYLIIQEQGFNPKLVEAFHQFTPHLHHLPKSLQREAYHDVLIYYNLVEDWHSLLDYAKQIEEWAREASDTTDTTSLAEALHYQEVALRGLGQASVEIEYNKMAETNSLPLRLSGVEREDVT